MPEIVLTTLNARYIHASFGLRYLMANLGPLRESARLIEFDIHQRSTDVVEAILSFNPRIVGVGVYIWNIEQATRVVAELKRVRPELIVVLGGPEVSYETEQQEIVRHADYVITGEADQAFAALCQTLLASPGAEPSNVARTIQAALPGFEIKRRPSGVSLNETPQAVGTPIVLPYDFYSDEDIAQRVVYVEASRGCPFACEFCLSSLDIPVRNVPLDAFLAAMQRLLDRGLKQFKFVDRTFNLNLTIGKAILQFFFERYAPGLFLHFEMIPDRLPEALRESISRFPPGALQFEVGIQTFNEGVSDRISRRQDNAKVEENLRWLRNHTGVHVHADLIVGLPGETLQSFAEGFDRLVALHPQEIQVGLLKRLRGTPIIRHDQEFAMVYSSHPPYEILQNSTLNFTTMQRMRRFARFWDLIANSGNFVRTTPRIWSATSPFSAFMELSEWLYEATGRQTHAISLDRLARLIFTYLSKHGQDESSVAIDLWQDLAATGRRDCPDFLRAFLPADTSSRKSLRPAPPRQARHLQAGA